MAVTDRTVAVAARTKARVNRIVDARANDLRTGWARAWRELRRDYEDLIAELMSGERWPSRSTVVHSEQVLKALHRTSDSISALTDPSDLADDIAELAASGDADLRALLATQLPKGTTLDDIGGTIRVATTELDAIVHRTTEQITARWYPISAESTEAMKSELVRGIAYGSNPRVAARTMLARTEGVFNGGRWRAENIARTEMIDANRDGALASRKANSDLVTGWMWLATLSKRTCPSCLSKNGSIHPATEPGPLDHQSGRCTSVEVLRPWAELGLPELDEPAHDFPDARAWFDDLSRDEQVEIMGKKRLDAFERGEIGWDDLSAKYTTPGWRPSYRTPPVRTR